MCSRSTYQKLSKQLSDCYNDSRTEQDYQYCHKVYVGQVDNCYNKRNVGQSCNSNDDCYSSICVARPGGPGNVCVANSSQNKRNTGQSCNRNSDCLSNNCVASPGSSGNICVGRNLLR